MVGLIIIGSFIAYIAIGFLIAGFIDKATDDKDFAAASGMFWPIVGVGFILHSGLFRYAHDLGLYLGDKSLDRRKKRLQRLRVRLAAQEEVRRIEQEFVLPKRWKDITLVRSADYSTIPN